MPRPTRATAHDTPAGPEPMTMTRLDLEPIRMSSFADPAVHNTAEAVEDAPLVSVVLPCLNEASTIETCIRKALAGLATAGVPGEVVVADNGSTDGSIEIAARAGARVVDVPLRGY